MHCMLAWGRKLGEPPLTQEEHKTLEEALEGHSWASPAAGIYVVGLTYGTAEQGDIQDKIREKARGADLQSVCLLLSPPIDEKAGLYIGIAEKPQWDEINRRTGHFDAVEKLRAKGDSDKAPAP